MKKTAAALLVLQIRAEILPSYVLLPSWRIIIKAAGLKSFWMLSDHWWYRSVEHRGGKSTAISRSDSALLGAGDKKALSELLDLLSYDTDAAQETEYVTDFMVWDLGCAFKGALFCTDWQLNSFLKCTWQAEFNGNKKLLWIWTQLIKINSDACLRVRGRTEHFTKRHRMSQVDEKSSPADSLVSALLGHPWDIS